MNVLISVIIPVYNTEKYLRGCLESVVGQTYRDIEVILVDDGSTDSSGAICDEYASADPRVKVLHKQNEGVVAAREDGIHIATGEWLAFVDSDDWISPEMYAKMLAAAKEDTDMVMCNVTYHRREVQEEPVNVTERAKGGDLLAKTLDGTLQGWLVCKIYRREFWERCRVSIPHDVKMMEDTLAMVQLYAHSPKVQTVDDYLYYYNLTNENSATNIDRPLLYMRAVKSLQYIEQYLREQGLYEKYADGFSRMVLQYLIPLLPFKGVKGVKQVYPSVISTMKNYPLNGVNKVKYWTFMNTGVAGEMLYKLYLTANNCISLIVNNINGGGVLRAVRKRRNPSL